jgi:hypothetical protein
MLKLARKRLALTDRPAVGEGAAVCRASKRLLHHLDSVRRPRVSARFHVLGYVSKIIQWPCTLIWLV